MRKSKDLFDFDESNLSMLAEAVELAEINGMAVERALQTHRVMKFVRDLPFEQLEYHKKISSKTYPAISETFTDFELRKYRSSGSKKMRHSDIVSKGRTNMFWTLPAHDTSGIDLGHCGIIRPAETRDLPLSACTNDKKHYARGKANHCWRLACSFCCNSTALKMGVKAENKILAPTDIHERKTGKKIEFSHWVISPPQEWFIDIMHNSKRFARAYDSVIDLVQACGIQGGTIVFHPWRLHDMYEKFKSGERRREYDHTRPTQWPDFIKDDDGQLKEQYRNLEQVWMLGPHFHIVGHGRFIDTSVFHRFVDSLNDENGYWPTSSGEDDDQQWVVKKIHPKKKLRSIRFTVAYLLTHSGLGYFDYDPDLSEFYKNMPMFDSKDDVFEIRHDLDPSAEWTDWLRTCYQGHFQSIRYFGDSNATRVIAEYKERQIRVCPECGSPICTFMGLHDCNPQEDLVTKKSKIRVMKDDYEAVDEFIRSNRSDMREEGQTILNLAMTIPQCSTPETQGVQDFTENDTREIRAERNDRCLIYVPSIHGQGLDPKIVSRKEMRKALTEGE